MSEKRSYAEIYLLVCDEIRSTAENKLERSLTSQELAHIYNAGSLMMLEVVERGVETSSKENLSRVMLSASFSDRLQETRDDFPNNLEEKLLNQTLSPQMRAKLQQIPYIYTGHQIVRRLEQTAQEARYEELVHILDELI